MKKQLWALMLAVGLAGAMMGLPASGQQAGGGGGGAAGGGGGGGGGGGRRGGGAFDPAAFRQRMEDQMKADMGATDDEWKVLQPKIQKVQELQQQSAAGRFGALGGGRRGRGGPGGAGGAAAPAADASAVAKASQELRALLVNDDGTPNKTSTDDQIKEKLKALRDAKAKAKEEVTAAQKDLQSVATVRQEAVLVSRGILE